MVTIHQTQQGSKEWAEARVGKYTGSNASLLLTSFGAGEHAQATLDTFKGNFYTKRGHILEDEAIELYEAITGNKVERPGYVTNDLFPECLYSPDGIADQILIEVKCFNQKKHEEMLNGEIPIKILAQIHYGLTICELKLAHLVIYNPELPASQAFKIIPIKAKASISRNFKRILQEVNYA